MALSVLAERRQRSPGERRPEKFRADRQSTGTLTPSLSAPPPLPRPPATKYECRFGGGTRASNQITVCERRCHKFPQWCPEALWAGQGKVREGTMEWFPLQGGDGGGAYRGKRGQRLQEVFKLALWVQIL